MTICPYANKARYASWTAAERDAKAIRRNRGHRAHTYHCRDCSGFHVGRHERLPKRKKDDR